MNCGNSSIEWLRRKWPRWVMRGSSLILNMGPSASLRDWRPSSWLSASFTMVRNLYMENIRNEPSGLSLPTRRCL